MIDILILKEDDKEKFVSFKKFPTDDNEIIGTISNWNESRVFIKPVCGVGVYEDPLLEMNPNELRYLTEEEEEELPEYLASLNDGTDEEDE